MTVEYNDYELVYLVREQNEEALHIIIEKYSPLIGKIASSYYGIGYDYQDFFQEGRMAFIKAIYSFDENSNYSFYSYAMTCVRNAITTSYRRLKRTSGLDQLTDYDEHPLVSTLETAGYYHYDSEYTYLNEKLIIEMAMNSDKILSPFEKQCLKYFLLGHNYNEIAIILNLSPKKIDNALSRCKSKLKNLNKMNSSIGESF